jgi:septum site-determining protein MinC
MGHLYQGLFFDVSSSTNPAFSFDIKSGHLSTVNLIFRTADLGLIETDLKARFGDVPDFFDDDAVCIDLTALDGAVAAGLDWERLLSMLKAYRMRPIAVKGLIDASQPVALGHGLLIQPDVGNSQIIDKSEAKPAEVKVSDPAAVAIISSSAMVIDKPLRSGQRVYAKGKDLVMLAMVNAGAEVIADGHIHVYAPLRGRAIAGARGDVSARIFALNFSPELVSIAGVYKSVDGDLPVGIEGQIAQAALVVSEQEERLIYQALGR